MRKIIFLSLLLTCSGCHKIKSPTNPVGQYDEVFLQTDKESYTQGETIKIAIQNKSAFTLFLQYHIPDGGGREYLILLYQEKKNNNWDDPIGFPYPTGWTIAKRLESGKTYVDSLWFNPPGTYRFLIPFSWIYQTDRIDTLYSNEFTNNPLTHKVDSVTMTKKI